MLEINLVFLILMNIAPSVLGLAIFIINNILTLFIKKILMNIVLVNS